MVAESIPHLEHVPRDQVANREIAAYVVDRLLGEQLPPARLPETRYDRGDLETGSREQFARVVLAEPPQVRAVKDPLIISRPPRMADGSRRCGNGNSRLVAEAAAVRSAGTAQALMLARERLKAGLSVQRQ